MMASNHNIMVLLALTLGTLTACSAGGGEPKHFIDMEKADALAQDWLDQKPHTNIAWIGALKTKHDIAGHLPEDVCYSIWNGHTESMPDETLTTQAQRCDYLAERLAQTLGAFGFPVNDAIIMKSENLRDVGLNYDGHKIDCIIGSYDKTKMPEWDTYSPTRSMNNGFYSCNGGSPYAFDKHFKKYNESIKARKANGERVYSKLGVPSNYKKEGYTESDYPLWKYGTTD